ncbi:MAG TPA: DNA translocase FtsK [Candidatus Paceibacterota bacterium]|nr:DNA translocase FtsK [Candidatus Paceibacterota bacterium]
MARKSSKSSKSSFTPAITLPSKTKRAIIIVLFVIVGMLLVLAPFSGAGPIGDQAYTLLRSLVGIGYFLLPILFFVLAGNAMREQEETTFSILKGIASAIFLLSGLGFVAIVSQDGGLIGATIADPLVRQFDIYASLIVLGGLALISLLVLLEGNIPVESAAALITKIRGLFGKKEEVLEPAISGIASAANDRQLPPRQEETEEETYDEEPVVAKAPQRNPAQERETSAAALQALLGEYNPPPLSLLERDKGRPGVGDIKGNANIIKRTLQNFGITVELDEISIGPSVTRYAIKPAEGVRLQKIISLQTNLELALAAHPVRIEAPIPGKSLVGIEVPNTSKVTVGLGTLLESPDFSESRKPLMVALGRDIAGASHFANVAKMPHALIAGATGSGKSVTIHAVIASLLFRMGPSRLRFLMIDPKRVELTLYNPIPHLLSPVITDAKRAITALRWAGKEMERRYNILEEHRVRDIDSYHENVLAPALEALRKKGGQPDEGEKVPEGMPYIVIVIDELADIMQTYPRELEGAIVRLAQMSRAVGIHLIVSTQRPSVNVITGLIKANIPARLALQVASQIDSRTILDQGGAEKLLGAGDMLYLSGDMGKPVRLQSAFISETEVKKVVDYIAKNNEAELPVDIGVGSGSSGSNSNGDSVATGGFSGDDEEIDDDMYEAARAAVLEAGKASTSYLQRKLRIGYARAARLIDILEERGVIGPGDGAKPREILGAQPVDTPPSPSEEL